VSLLKCQIYECWLTWQSLDPESKANLACGEDSDCINRATKMECIGDCGCGVHCQNQRFQHREYAQVSVIKTEKKGYGLRADADLRPGDFIFEYIGEVVGEAAFRRRTRQYDDEGIKHFYFMSLNKGEFIDATKKGNLGRFCNHSCNPNCYVDKWVVDDKLRMGIFAERNIKTGEELVFNYNVDRYGADPQPCYCGEPNCTGFIGGKTQTERSTKLSHDTIEALGIEDADDWDTAVAKRPRKRKTGEDDEEYVDSVQPKSLAEDGVTKVMATLMQCKEKWIAVKLLNRIQRTEDEKVRNRVVKMHGYRILKTALSNFSDDVNVVLQILDILFKLPRITRNKIQDSKIEDTVGQLKTSENEQVASKAADILDIWSKLEVGYRIPRMKRDPNAAPQARPDRFERREPGREREKSRSRSKSPVAPRGPSQPGARQNRFGGQGPPFRRGPPFSRKRDRDALPDGWFPATDNNGKTYYYNTTGTTTWTRPTQASSAPPPPPSQALLQQQKLDEIIKGITAENAKKMQSSTPKQDETPKEEVKPPKEKQEKWKSLPEEKQRKIYENTVSIPGEQSKIKVLISP
jgi:[histone H3]-lysine36 N-trimethyltransferase